MTGHPTFPTSVRASLFNDQSHILLVSPADRSRLRLIIGAFIVLHGLVYLLYFGQSKLN